MLFYTGDPLGYRRRSVIYPYWFCHCEPSTAQRKTRTQQSPCWKIERLSERGCLNRFFERRLHCGENYQCLWWKAEPHIKRQLL